MKTAVKRKLIDIKSAVFDSLMVQAQGEGLSLKKYIEALLERESQKSGHGIPHSVKDARVISLVGIGKRAVAALDTNLLLDVVEDILQAVCAQEGGCEAILTHNPGHFHIGPGLCPTWICPQVSTPEDFLYK